MESFRQRGLRVTPQRQLLFRLLDGHERHPTADQLFAEADALMPGISLRTVYQTLNDLVELGELRALDLGTGAARFDPNLAEHHHVVCDRCGSVRDVRVDGSDRLMPDPLEAFDVRATQIVFRGVCAACANPT